jgi:outer membrane lipoprotein carrier protein
MVREKPDSGEQLKKTLMTMAFLLAWLTGAWCSAEQSAETATVPELLKQIQAAYDCGGFTARFEQVSTLKAMNITDTASGRAYFMEPGRMRWEYVEPEPQQIITDGKTIWIYKPLENQVMTGEVSSVFGDGQGVNFLAAIRTIEEKNQVSIDPDRQREGCYTLKLVPNQQTPDLAVIYLYVSKKTGLVEELQTINVYDDTTLIMFSDVHLGGSIEASLFTFAAPADADVMQLDPRN